MPDRVAFTTIFQSPGSEKSVSDPEKVSPRFDKRAVRDSPAGEITTASIAASTIAVPSGCVRPTSKAKVVPGDTRRCANRTQSESFSASSCFASQRINCRQKRRCCSPAPCITQRQVESGAKASTLPSPYSLATKSGCPAAVTASGLAVGSNRPRSLAPSRAGKACHAARDS